MTDHAAARERSTDDVTTQCSALQLADAFVVYDAENREAWVKSSVVRSVDP